ncbi:hypothetical protein PHYSODRAFT_294667 [Phytophthora sojae]|uniref:Uncharacterized protein n=1 Tax=Phytophthora sojae (strain P6497) TaxID=1094619 RepID=G4YQ69_PHYSP|nr:hypothetical protein PHYSODRAFT_294667 [Phytophthora sojae]EGZ29573.1 hypothetical protein PHYSODRAFT_294667 [Phytophthora sojae]|eukprot:XP_009516848.1 hypothetical protein PHYSODRAFT_294667 [Phytophthora sojae]
MGNIAQQQKVENFSDLAAWVSTTQEAFFRSGAFGRVNAEREFAKEPAGHKNGILVLSAFEASTSGRWSSNMALTNFSNAKNSPSSSRLPANQGWMSLAAPNRVSPRLSLMRSSLKRANA